MSTAADGADDDGLHAGVGQERRVHPEGLADEGRRPAQLPLGGLFDGFDDGRSRRDLEGAARQQAADAGFEARIAGRGLLDECFDLGLDPAVSPGIVRRSIPNRDDAA